MYTRKTFPEFVPCRYNTCADLQARLDGTICRYEGRLVFVRVMSDTGQPDDYSIWLYNWPDADKKIKRIEADDPSFDISLLDLGYMNYLHDGKNHVIYPYRSTNKKYKQGTCTSYTHTARIDGGPAQFGSYSLQSQGFVDMIEGRYPPVSVCELHPELAVSPDVAIRTDALGVREYFWRMNKVAIKVPGQKLHRLDTEFSPLIDKILGAYL